MNICIALRPKNGGFIEEYDCLRLLQQIRGTKSQEVTIKDLRKAVESLKKLGSDFRIISQGGKNSKRLICSVSLELDTDHMALLSQAEQGAGMITLSQMSKKGFDVDRFERAINRLLSDGLAWEDT